MIQRFLFKPTQLNPLKCSSIIWLVYYVSRRIQNKCHKWNWKIKYTMQNVCYHNLLLNTSLGLWIPLTDNVRSFKTWCLIHQVLMHWKSKAITCKKYKWFLVPLDPTMHQQLIKFDDLKHCPLFSSLNKIH